MIKSFKTFWKDFAEITKSNLRCIKKHWFGYIVLVLVIIAGESAWFFSDQIKDSFKKRLTKSVKVEREELE